MKQVIVLVGMIILSLVLFAGVIGAGNIGKEAAEAGFDLREETSHDGAMQLPMISLDPEDHGWDYWND
jgi:ABC-type methionine transport system permease subunit